VSIQGSASNVCITAYTPRNSALIWSSLSGHFFMLLKVAWQNVKQRTWFDIRGFAPGLVSMSSEQASSIEVTNSQNRTTFTLSDKNIPAAVANNHGDFISHAKYVALHI
jgi:hypothetical protein